MSNLSFLIIHFSDHFSQIEDDRGYLNFPKFEAYLRELLQVCGDVHKDKMLWTWF